MCEPIAVTIEHGVSAVDFAACCRNPSIERSPQPTLDGTTLPLLRCCKAASNHFRCDLNNPAVLREHAWLHDSLLWDDTD